MNKNRISFNEIASRVTGLSIPIFGISWAPAENERKVVRDLLLYLGDRRALYNDFAHELHNEVTQSVLAIRSELTSALTRLPENSAANFGLKAMRAACREYLDNSKPMSSGGSYAFIAELGRLRTIFGVHIAHLAISFGLDIDGELLRVIPPELRDPKLLEP